MNTKHSQSALTRNGEENFTGIIQKSINIYSIAIIPTYSDHITDGIQFIQKQPVCSLLPFHHMIKLCHQKFTSYLLNSVNA